MASKLWTANWSYGIKRYNFSKEDQRLDVFSDFDCMAIHEAKQKLDQEATEAALVQLEDFVVDVGNMVAYPRASPFAIIGFKVFRTDQNDRGRSRLSSRKPLDMATANHPKASSFFAKKAGEFGFKWMLECNGKKWPTMRQVIAGLEASYEMDLHRKAAGATNGALPDTIATYRRVFDTILALVALPDLDRPF